MSQEAPLSAETTRSGVLSLDLGSDQSGWLTERAGVRGSAEPSRAGNGSAMLKLEAGTEHSGLRTLGRPDRPSESLYESWTEQGGRITTCCVVACVVTLPSLPVSGGIVPCHSAP